MGLDLAKGTIRNNLEAGVIEPAMSKVKIIQVMIMKHVNTLVYGEVLSSHFPLILFCFLKSGQQFATEAAITILRIDDMIKLMKDESQNEE